MAETDILGLAQPLAGTRNWDSDINQNFQIIDDKTIVVSAWNREPSLVLTQGMVVVIDHNNDDSVLRSTEENDQDVVGVVISPTVAPLNRGWVAVTGYVGKVKSEGEVVIGDYLTTSSIDGYTRKAEWYERRFGRALSDQAANEISAVLFQPDMFDWANMLCLFDLGVFGVHFFGP